MLTDEIRVSIKIGLALSHLAHCSRRTYTYSVILSENNFPRHYQPLNGSQLLRLTAYLQQIVVLLKILVHSCNTYFLPQMLSYKSGYRFEIVITLRS